MGVRIMSASDVTLDELADLIDTNAVAKLLRCKRHTVYIMIGDGRLPEPLRLGRLMYWKPSDIEAAVRAMPHGYRRRKKDAPGAEAERPLRGVAV